MIQELETLLQKEKEILNQLTILESNPNVSAKEKFAQQKYYRGVLKQLNEEKNTLIINFPVEYEEIED